MARLWHRARPSPRATRRRSIPITHAPAPPFDARAALEHGLRASYVLERELGRGGMATVYLARDLKHDRPVALKLLRPALAVTLSADRFRREITTAARLQHPHILSVHDSGEVVVNRQSSVVGEGLTTDDSRLTTLLWYTMPYVPGQTLRERLAREGALAVEEALRITGEAGRALHYAHREGVIHRDVKPENILLTLDGDTLVADFGIARAVGSIGDADQVRLTQAGIALGTPAYMAPEQATGQRMMDARTDQYSLAVVCYEMLTGKKPFTGSSAAAIIASRFTSPPPSARAHRAGIPARAEQAILRALSLDPAERFESVLDFIRALGAPGLTPAAGMPAIPDAALPATAAPAAVPELPPAPAALKRSWVILAVLALLALVVAGIVATRG